MEDIKLFSNTMCFLLRQSAVRVQHRSRRGADCRVRQNRSRSSQNNAGDSVADHARHSAELLLCRVF